MNWLKKLPQSRRANSGLEWLLWRKLPLIALLGTLLPLLCLGLVHLLGGHKAQAQVPDSRRVRRASIKNGE